MPTIPEEQTQATPTTNFVADLRDALRSRRRADESDAPAWERRRQALAVERAATPLLVRCSERLLRYCARLARGAPRAGLEGDDLALHAWEKLMPYLQAPDGDRVRDDAHFERLLFRAAQTHLLDALDRPAAREPLAELDAPSARGEPPVQRCHPDPAPDELLLPKDSRYLRLVEELFDNAERFRRTYRQTNQRHPRNYQALVLYQVAAFWREEAGGGGAVPDASFVRAVRHWVGLLGIPEATWNLIEQAARRNDSANDGLCPHLLRAVNASTGANVQSRATLAVLRHEMNRFAAG